MGFERLTQELRTGRRALVMLAGVTLVSASLGGISGTSATAATGAYVGRVASATLAASSASTTLTTTSQVAAGNSLLVGILLTSTSSLTGAVSVSDAAGNPYSIDRDQNDAAPAQ